MNQEDNEHAFSQLINKQTWFQSVLEAWSHWWVYAALAVAAFFGFLLLNYIVKIINDARVQNRSIRINRKASASQSTQVQTPYNDVDNKMPRLLENMLEKPNLTPHGISLVFNKEDNLMEDKRNKELPKNVDRKVPIDTTVKIDENENHENLKSVFLGSIYKGINAGISSEPRNSENKHDILDHDSVLNEIVDKLVLKIKESKSTPSVARLIDVQNEEDLKEWVMDLVVKRTPDNKE